MLHSVCVPLLDLALQGQSVVDPIRTSYGMFIRRMSDPIIERIERRISVFTHLPMSHQEDIQVRPDCVFKHIVCQLWGSVHACQAAPIACTHLYPSAPIRVL